jgi:hypothetical protein
VSSDPLAMLEQIEAAKRGLKRGEAMNPACIESYLAVLAQAVVDGTPSTPDYRLSSVRAALLVRLGKCYGIPLRPLVYDLTAVVSKIQDARHSEILRREAEETETLEHMWDMSE